MKLVIGGFAAGKLEFAKNELGVTDYNDACFGDANCIYRLADMVDDKDFDENLKRYIDLNPDCVIICDEVGGGIVPIQKADREHREKVGRVCCALAKQAESVYRVFCGIGTKIK